MDCPLDVPVPILPLGLNTDRFSEYRHDGNFPCRSNVARGSSRLFTDKLSTSSRLSSPDTPALPWRRFHGPGGNTADRWTDCISSSAINSARNHAGAEPSSRLAHRIAQLFGHIQCERHDHLGGAGREGNAYDVGTDGSHPVWSCTIGYRR